MENYNPHRFLECVQILNWVSDYPVCLSKNTPLVYPSFHISVESCSGYPLGTKLGFLKTPHIESSSLTPRVQDLLDCVYFSVVPKINSMKLLGTHNNWIGHGLMETLEIDDDYHMEPINEFSSETGVSIITKPKSSLDDSLLSGFFRLLDNDLSFFASTYAFNLKKAKKSLSVPFFDLFSLEIHFHRLLIDTYAQTYNEHVGGVPSLLWHDMFTARNPILPSTQNLRLSTLVSRDGVIFNQLLFFDGILCQSQIVTAIAKESHLESIKVKIKADQANDRLYLLDPRSDNWIAVEPVELSFKCEINNSGKMISNPDYVDFETKHQFRNTNDNLESSWRVVDENQKIPRRLSKAGSRKIVHSSDNEFLKKRSKDINDSDFPSDA